MSSQAVSHSRPAEGRTAPEAAAEAAVARPPYLWALVAGVAVFALYAYTLAPTTAFWDTSEYIATAHILGIPHPPGNPLFVVLARAWELLLSPFPLTPAVRINLFSALMGASSAAFFFLITHRILGFFTPSERVRRLGAAAGVLVGATAFTVWNQSNVNEKVYTVSMLTIAFLSWLAFLWRDHVEAHSGRKGRWHDDNVLVLMAYLLALSVANHLMAFLAAPALLVFVLMVKPRALANWKVYVFALLAAVVGLSANLFLPIRAGLHPIINEAEPTCLAADGKTTDVGSALVSVLTFGNAGCPNLSASLKREQYQKPSFLKDRQAPFWAQMANYFQYFDWQWSRSVQGERGYFAPGRMPITLLFFGLGLYGAWEHWRRDRKSFAYLGVLVATLSVGLVIYMNFKYGYMQAAALGLRGDMSEVRERDYFFLVSFALWGIWCGVGLTAAWLAATETLRGKGARTAVAVGLGAVACIPLVLNWPYASRRGDYAARDWAYNLLQSVEPYGVLFTNGDNDTFPLWYAQEVEGIRRDVTVIVTSYLNTDWYARQLRQLTSPCDPPGKWATDLTRNLCQRPFQPTTPEVASLYGRPRAPTKTILPLSNEQIGAAAAQGYVTLPDSVLYEARGVTALLPAGKTLLTADQFALVIIQNAWGDRPIFFAATTDLHYNLGLFPHTARHGLAFKLVTPQEAQRLQPMPQDPQMAPVYGAYTDVQATRALLDRVFVYHDLIRKPHWPDDATRGIPTYFGYAELSMAAVDAMRGDTAAANRRARVGQEWLDLSAR
jgi:hypothetical protein